MQDAQVDEWSVPYLNGVLSLLWLAGMTATTATVKTMSTQFTFGQTNGLYQRFEFIKPQRG